MSPTPRAAGLLVLVAVAALLVPRWVAALVALAVVGAVLADVRRARAVPRVARLAPRVLARGGRAPLSISVTPPASVSKVLVRQATPAELLVEPALGDGGLEAVLVGLHRGRHVLPPVSLRCVGAWGLARVDHDVDGALEVRVIPDLPGAYRLRAARRRGGMSDAARVRGPVGLGTEFESLRDWTPDDDAQRINWAATARTGRPMVNQYRVEREQRVLCLVDAGRLMAGPLGRATRLDVALDALAAVGVSADELGDRFGAMVFSDRVVASLEPRRRGALAVVQALAEVEPTPVESAYELVFRRVAAAKRAVVVVLTDFVDEESGAGLSRAAPLLARRHALVVATVRDPELTAPLDHPPSTPLDLYAAAAALDLERSRRRLVGALRSAGTLVVEASPAALPAATAAAYIRLKARAAA